jgi:hypothetical protein
MDINERKRVKRKIWKKVYQTWDVEDNLKKEIWKLKISEKEKKLLFNCTPLKKTLVLESNKHDLKKGDRIIAKYDDFDFDADIVNNDEEWEHNYDMMQESKKFYFCHQMLNYINFQEIKPKYFQISNQFVDRLIIGYEDSEEGDIIPTVEDIKETFKSLGCCFLVLTIKGRKSSYYGGKTKKGFADVSEFDQGPVWEGVQFIQMYKLLAKLCRLNFCAMCDSISSVALRKLKDGEYLLILDTDPESG